MSKEYKRYVEVLCRFTYMGRPVIIHKPLGISKDYKYFTITDELTGMSYGHTVLKTPTERAARLQLNKVKDSIKKITPEMYRKGEKQLAAAPTYHQWKKMPF